MQTVHYVADSLAMQGTLVRPAAGQGGAAPGVLVFPDIFGLGEHARLQAERLAALGYIALACDLHGDGRRFPDMADAVAALGPARGDATHTHARTTAALDTLLAQPGVDPARIATVGYCMGGTYGLQLARSGAAVAGTVALHAGLARQDADGTARIAGKVLACIGADDPLIPPAERAAFETEMRAAGVDWRLHLYGGVVHSFTNPQAAMAGTAEYNAGADRRSWLELTSFLAEVFAAG